MSSFLFWPFIRSSFSVPASKSNGRREPRYFERALSEFEDNLNAMADLCLGRRQRLLLLTQPVMWSPDLSEELRDLLWGMTYDQGAYDVEVLAEMIGEMNEVTRRVAREKNVDCVDLASLLPKDTTVFYDDCHFNTSGCEKIARILTDFFSERLAKGAG